MTRLYDQARRRKAVRKGRERGCWLFVAADDLTVAGIDPYAETPWYRVWASPRGGLRVRLYTKGWTDDCNATGQQPSEP